MQPLFLENDINWLFFNKLRFIWTRHGNNNNDEIINDFSSGGNQYDAI